MAKRKSGGSGRRPAPEQDQMAIDALMTSVFSGISFMGATLIFAMTGGAGLQVSANSGRVLAMVGFALGLAAGLLAITTLLRRFAERIRARSRNLYRGAWIGTFFSLTIIVLLYYFPSVAFPHYCPPGAICQ